MSSGNHQVSDARNLLPGCGYHLSAAGYEVPVVDHADALPAGDDLLPAGADLLPRGRYALPDRGDAMPRGGHALPRGSHQMSSAPGRNHLYTDHSADGRISGRQQGDERVCSEVLVVTDDFCGGVSRLG